MKTENLPQSLSVSALMHTRLFRPDGTQFPSENAIPSEHLLEVYIDNAPAYTLTCTPTMLPELVLGRLITDGYICSMADVSLLRFSDDGHRAFVTLQPDTSSARCSQTLPVKKAAWEPAWVFALAEHFSTDSKLHRSTRAAHSCYLARGIDYLCCTEDISRHNAVDKAIGYLAREGIAPADCLLYTTGRVPADMVEKVAAGGIPVLVSKAVPTDAGLALARQRGLTLICRAWPDSFDLCE